MVLSLANGRFGYSNAPLFEGLDLSLEAGEACALLGPSGSGKTTLVHLLAGLLPLHSGRLWWGGREVTALSEDTLARLRRSYVGLVFQDHHLLPELTALENVCLPGILAGFTDVVRGRELLARVGLAEHMQQQPRDLSGGERQRVAVARAMFMRPRLLLADEPTGSLDYRNSGEVLDMLLELATEGRTAVLVATHDEALVASLPAWHLMDGQLSI